MYNIFFKKWLMRHRNWLGPFSGPPKLATRPWLRQKPPLHCAQKCSQFIISTMPRRLISYGSREYRCTLCLIERHSSKNASVVGGNDDRLSFVRCCQYFGIMQTKYSKSYCPTKRTKICLGRFHLYQNCLKLVDAYNI